MGGRKGVCCGRFALSLYFLLSFHFFGVGPVNPVAYDCGVSFFSPPPFLVFLFL